MPLEQVINDGYDDRFVQPLQEIGGNRSWDSALTRKLVTLES